MKRLTTIGIALLLIVGASACGSDSQTAGRATELRPDLPSTTETTIGETAAAAATTGPRATTATSFPFTFKNCDVDVILPASPKRIVITEASAVATLDAVGALDRVVARTGEYPPEYFSTEVNAKLDKIPALTSTQSSTGGVEISLEVIIDAKPDLVMGYETDTIKRDGLAKAGINLFIFPPYCKTPPPVSFANIYDEVRFFGRVFENEELASSAADKMSADVTSITAKATQMKGKKAAALFVSSDGSALYAYSALGMVHPQMEALGLVNVFAEMKERVPEVSIEEILNRDPEVLILLYTDTKVTPEKITSLVADLQGAKGMAAFNGGKVIPFLFNFSEPPSPLVVDGLSRLSALLAK